MFTPVQIGKRVLKIRFSNRAIYRHGTLDRPLDLSEVAKDERSFTALCQWLWATIIDANPFKSPDDLADEIEEQQVPDLVRTLIDAHKLANPPKADAKNEEGSTPSPSPASSSGSPKTNS